MPTTKMIRLSSSPVGKAMKARSITTVADQPSSPAAAMVAKTATADRMRGAEKGFGLAIVFVQRGPGHRQSGNALIAPGRSALQLGPKQLPHSNGRNMPL